MYRGGGRREGLQGGQDLTRTTLKTQKQQDGSDTLTELHIHLFPNQICWKASHKVSRDSPQEPPASVWKCMNMPFLCAWRFLHLTSTVVRRAPHQMTHLHIQCLSKGHRKHNETVCKQQQLSGKVNTAEQIKHSLKPCEVQFVWRFWKTAERTRPVD